MGSSPSVLYRPATYAELGLPPLQQPGELRSLANQWKEFNERISVLEKMDKELKLTGFDKEFAFIEAKPKVPQVALSRVNQVKNRYYIPPATATAVSLPVEGSDPHSFYINANYINGEIPGSERQYIATQGPLATTIDDFWRMVWNEHASVVVMLTRCWETGSMKCTQYWPSSASQPMLCGQIEVTLKGTEQRGEYIRRELSLKLRNDKTKEKRRVWHFHYFEWPDHGIPADPHSFATLLAKVDGIRKGRPRPIVIHCSAGIGRTGVFATAHIIDQKLRHSLFKTRDMATPVVPVLAVLPTVERLRTQRTGMIQKPVQYLFCYHVVRDIARAVIGEFEKDPAGFIARHTAVMEAHEERGSRPLNLDSTAGHALGDTDAGTATRSKRKGGKAAQPLAALPEGGEDGAGVFGGAENAGKAQNGAPHDGAKDQSDRKRRDGRAKEREKKRDERANGKRSGRAGNHREDGQREQPARGEPRDHRRARHARENGKDDDRTGREGRAKDRRRERGERQAQSSPAIGQAEAETIATDAAGTTGATGGDGRAPRRDRAGGKRKAVSADTLAAVHDGGAAGDAATQHESAALDVPDDARVATSGGWSEEDHGEMAAAVPRANGNDGGPRDGAPTESSWGTTDDEEDQEDYDRARSRTLPASPGPPGQDVVDDTLGTERRRGQTWSSDGMSQSSQEWHDAAEGTAGNAHDPQTAQPALERGMGDTSTTDVTSENSW